MIYNFIDIILMSFFIVSSIYLVMKKHDQHENITLIIYAILNSIILLIVLFISVNYFPAALLLLSRSTVLAAALVLSALTTVIFKLYRRTGKSLPKIVYLIPIIIIIPGILSLFTDWILVSVTHLPDILWTSQKYGSLFWPWIVLNILYIVGLIILLLNIVKNSNYRKTKNQMMIIMTGLFLGGAIGFICAFILPALGYTHLTRWGISISLSVLFSTSLYAYTASYFIDVGRELKRLVLRAIFLCIALAPFLILFIIFRPQWDQNNIFNRVLVIFLMSIMVHIFLVKIQNVIDNILGKSQINFESVLTEFANDLQNPLDIEHLCRSVKSILSKSLNTENINFYIMRDKCLKNSCANEDILDIPSDLERVFKGDRKIFDDEDFVFLKSLAPYSRTAHDYFKKYDTRLVLPLVVNDKIIGVIHIGEKSDDSGYHIEEIDFLKNFRNHLSISLNNSIMYYELELRISEKTTELQNQKNALEYLLVVNERDMYIFRSLNELSQKLLAIPCYNLDDFLAYIVDIFPGFIHLENIAVYRFPPSHDELRLSIKKSLSMKHRVFAEKVPLTTDNPYGRIAAQQRPIFISDINESPDYSTEILRGLGIEHTFIGIPIFYRNGIVAIIGFIDTTQREQFDKYDFYFINTVAHLFKVNIDKITYIEDKLNNERFTAIGQASANIIHDIKNPMAGIKGFAECMISPEFTESDKHDFAQLIIEESDRLVDMTNEILEYTKGIIQIDKTDYKFPDFVAEVKSYLSNLFKNKNISFKVSSKYKGKLYFDWNRFKRVIYNIAQNSYDVLEEGDLFSLTIEKDSDMLLFTMEDNGPGIPEDIQDTIFIPYVTKGKEHGTGLGMAIAKQITEHHGGTISFKSGDNGTIFYIRIPIKQV